jgi:hypothetical protein
MNISKHTFIPVLLFAITLSSCGHTAPTIYFNSTGEAPHYSSGTQTRFGAMHVWNASDVPDNNDLAYIVASDVTGGTNTKYLLIAPRLWDRNGWHQGTTLDNFNLTHSISLPDSDARAFFSALHMILSATPNDSTYFHYSCSAQLNIAPTTVNTNARGFSTVSTSVASETTWVTTCDLTFYLGAGTLTLADGTSWTESIPLDKAAIQQMESVLQTSTADLENQR